MERLLAHGADPSLKTRIDFCATPIEEAELMGNSEGAAMLQLLLRERGPSRESGTLRIDD